MQRIIVPGLVAALLGAGGAVAQTPFCGDLEERLAALDAVGSDPWNEGTAAIETAITRQKIDLDNAVAAARQMGCVGFAGILARGSGQCAGVNSGINRMRANLDRLYAQRRRGGGDSADAERERARLMRSMAANGCGGRFDGEAAAPARRAEGLFASLFRRRPAGGGWNTGGGWGGLGGLDFGYGTFRTLCVRTCDGYYFPVSFSTDSSGFARDAAACSQLCPGTEVALYVHRNPGEGTEGMVSLAGEPYASLPTAFQYRQRYDAACKCGPVEAQAMASPVPPGAWDMPPADVPEAPPGLFHDPWAFSARVPAAAPEPVEAIPPEALATIIPVPAPRPAGAEDPETAGNRAGDFVAKRMAPSPPVASIPGPDGRMIRLVGPPAYDAR